MRTVVLLPLLALLCTCPAEAQTAPSRERTLDLVRTCRYFVRENVPDGAQFPNQFDETPVIKVKGKTLVWQDQVKIRTPLFVTDRRFTCTFDTTTERVSIRWSK